MKILDTFAGIGGFSYAAEKLIGGFETTQFIEIDPFCQKVLKKHWPHVPIHDDIRTFTAKPFQYQVICGGFPCQDISVAGLQKGITEETRSGLFFELMRVIRMVRPQYVVLENVAAIINRGLDIVLRELSEAGYDAEWSVIRASSVGACHQRSRWWLVAYPNDNGLPSAEKCELNGEASDRTQKRQNQSCQSERSSEPSSSRAIQSSAKFTNSYSKGMERRKFTINEKMQKTGFTWKSNTPHLSPEWRKYVSKSVLCRGDDGLRNRVDRLRSLGNSVVPQCAAIPLQRVKDLYEATS
tara:strand:+ start:259 stop:1149 length:891 start_codon:yes stop_codon:yes gene_type:complete